jgi:hypothetical protein
MPQSSLAAQDLLAFLERDLGTISGFPHDTGATCCA